ncbi:MAG: glycosyltransferase, partial [Helicobacter sp.]|nr:glycosyltransferase [Helicobacter sp.]
MPNITQKKKNTQEYKVQKKLQKLQLKTQKAKDKLEKLQAIKQNRTKKKAPKNTNKNTNSIPKVSVIIPVYNVEQYLRECLDSVTSQTLKQIEIICIDDGSTDNSLEILKEYQAKDTRIKIIRQKNGGLSSARNAGLAVAKGEYIQFVDSDDYLRTDALQLLTEKAQENDLDMLTFGGYNFDGTSKSFQENSYWNFSWFPHTLNPDCMRFDDTKEFCHRIHVSSCLTMYKHQLIVNNQLTFFDGCFFEDNLFFIQALTRIERYGVLRENLYFRRIHNQQITKNWDKHFADYIFVASKVLEYLQNENVGFKTFNNYRSLYLNASKNIYSGFNKFYKKQHKEILDNFQNKYKNFVYVLKGTAPTRHKKLSLPPPLISKPIGAINLVKNHLAYKFGREFAKCKNPLNILTLPFSLLALSIRHNKRENILSIIHEIDPSKRPLELSRYQDYPQALEIQNSLSYKLGRVVTSYPLSFPFMIVLLYLKRIWSKSDSIKVSIIIPVYNSQKYLRECLDSVTNQTLKQIEIICIDDGSTDNSLEILKEYASKDERINILTQTNLYAGAARNAGLAVAKGEYIQFVDSDDWFDLNMCKRMYAQAKKDGSNIVVCGHRVYDEQLQNYISERTISYHALSLSPINPKAYKANILAISNPAAWNKLYKREFLLQKGLKFEALSTCNDLTFTYSTLMLASKISLMEEVFITYRTNSYKNITATRGEYAINIIKALKALQANINNFHLGTAY